MKYYLLTFLLLLSLAGAYDDIGYYRTSMNINLNLGCSYNDTYCPSTFVCNVSVYSPSGIIINNQKMGNTFYPQYNYTLLSDNITNNGLYYGRQVCCGSIGCNDYSFQFHINPQGKEYGTIEGIVYFIVLLILSGIFLLTLFSSIKLEFKNPRNRDGEVIKINWGKYLKLFLFGMAYMSFMGITYFAWNISYGILEFTELANFFNVLFRISYIIIYPALVVLFVSTLIMFVADKKNQKLLERGLTIK